MHGPTAVHAKRFVSRARRAASAPWRGVEWGSAEGAPAVSLAKRRHLLDAPVPRAPLREGVLHDEGVLGSEPLLAPDTP